MPSTNDSVRKACVMVASVPSLHGPAVAAATVRERTGPAEPGAGRPRASHRAIREPLGCARSERLLTKDLQELTPAGLGV